ncbi:MAG: Gfo/Idh/MocA family oxidoreductase [Clostridiales bacterium]|nr:Gfo/Idh/MocA family oxidoreductase [Clostridiales bacterium]
MRDINVGIIGCGGIAEGKHLPSIKTLGNVKMVAFCDVVEARARKAAEEYGIENANVYTDYTKMLEDQKGIIEAVHVLTPNSSHSPISIAAMESGCHVLCEKPMAKDVAGAKSMLDASKKTGKLLSIGYQNRNTPEAKYLKQICDSGDLGEVYYAEALALRRRAVPTWGVFLDEEAQGGGPLIDIGTHALDLTLWFINNYEPEMVVGSVYRKLADNENSANAWGPWNPKEYTVEDSAFGFIRFKNGATVVLKSSWALNMIDCIESNCILCGDKAGADMLDGLRINGEKFGKTYITKPGLEKDGVAFYDGSMKNPSDIEAENFYSAIINGTELTVKPEQALKVTEILAAIYESNRNGGKPIYFK